MKAETASVASALIRRSRVASLATLHADRPGIAMTPYAVLPAPFAFLVLVSALSAHTRDMFAHPGVALLIHAAEPDDGNVHALPRVAIEGDARPIAVGEPDYARARAAYAGRFPEMTGLFDLGDFTLFAIEPSAVRVVAGFAQAASITPAALAQAWTSGA